MKTTFILRKRRLTVIPLLTAAGAVVFVFESLIPQPLPWARLGLSNIVVLLALYYYGFREALAVSWLRVLVGGLFTGGLFSPAFIFGMTGGFFSAVVMAGARKTGKSRFSPIGISILGAAAHSVGQLAAAYLLFIGHKAIWNLLPYMLLTSIFTGGVVGVIGSEVLERVKIND